MDYLKYENYSIFETIASLEKKIKDINNIINSGNINEIKLLELNREINRLNNQLEYKANANEVRKKNVELNLNDFDEESRSAIAGADFNLNYVLGDKNVKSNNIDFLNVNLNHLSENCFIDGELPPITKSTVGFNISQKSQKDWLNGTAMGCYFKFPMTMFTKGENVKFEYELVDDNNCFSNVGYWVFYGSNTSPVEIEPRVSGAKTNKYAATFTIKDTTQEYIYINVFLSNVAKDMYNYSIKNVKVTRISSNKVIKCDNISGFLNSKPEDEINYTNIIAVDDAPDFSKIKLATNKTIEKISTKNNKVTLTGNDIAIQFPFNDEYDLKVILGLTCANNVMNFKKIYKVNKSTGQETLTDSYGTDWLAPIIVGAKNNADGDRPNGTGYYCSGNHDYNNADTGASKNARTTNIKFYIDGKKQESYDSNAEKVKITWDTFIQGYNTEKEDGTGREIIKEHYIVEFSDGKFNIENEITALEDVVIRDYYGMQSSCPNMFSDKVHFEIETHNGVMPINDSNPHKLNISTATMFKGNDRLEMYLDRNYGLGKFPSSSVDFSCFTSTWNKLYYVLVKNKPLELTQNNKVGWRGYYRFYSI